MNQSQAVQLVRDTFESAFAKAGFIRFVKNLLTQYEEAEITRTGNFIPEAFKDYVSKYERVGKYTDSDDRRIDILLVWLKRETSIERARSMQRNFVAGYLQGKYGSSAEKDAALVAFVSPDETDWRFSLVKLDYVLEEKDGKVRAKEEFTPSRRWSFLVGAHERSHTAQSRLVPLMADDEHQPTLAELEDAFNIETVTKEFFEKYRGLFIWTKEELDKTLKASPALRADFEKKGVNTVDLAKKLLGQIIFLYYLQKKGWFGVPRDGEWGAGSKNFLRELFEKRHGGHKNFFNDILEPLFYEALRIDRSHDDHYYSRFDCKIPFLNGGLFDPMGNYDWVKTDILLPDKLFSNTAKTKDGDTGDGILDVFDRYNFTVREDEPFEKEVAIDPELLGKAYEKFNAIRPDNFDEFLKALKSGKKGDESKFNKQYGVYYTPREIVHYMCQQSLINYLATELEEKASKEELALLIQSGETLHEHEIQAAIKATKTYAPKLPEAIRANAALIDEKLAAIRVCDPAVGSGAFPVGMMSEIVRTRAVLKTWTKMGKTRYDFKRECIENSLYGVDIDPGAVEIAKLRLWLSLIVDEDDIQNIKPLPNLDYKIVAGNSLLGLPDGILLSTEIRDKLEEEKRAYFYLTNPATKSKLREKINGLFLRLVESAKQYDPSLGDINFDIYTYFSEVFHDSGGFDVVIANPPWVSLLGKHGIDGGQNSKSLYLKIYDANTYMPNLYELFMLRGLKLLSDTGYLIYIIPDRFGFNESSAKLRRTILEQNTVLQVVYKWDFESVIADTMTLLLRKGITPVDAVLIKNRPEEEFLEIDKKHILSSQGCELRGFSSLAVKTLVEKIKNNATPLGKIAKSTSGFGGKSSEITTTRTKPKQIPVLKGASIQRYTIIKYFFFEFKDANLSGRTRDVQKLGQKEKILLRKTGDRIIATYDDSGIFPEQSLYFLYEVLPKVGAKYLLGLINSKLLTWYYLNFLVTNLDSTPQLKNYDLDALPINLTEPDRMITRLVDRILAAKRANPETDTSQWEREIDELVYALYGLTEEEIKVVEGR